MHQSSILLEDLPVEVLASIFRLLDPVGLISISQCSRAFRALIQPKRIHFVERLLQAECLEQHGGRPFHFRGRDNACDPTWSADNEDLESIRWACAVCMRCLPHINFDNHSILRLDYRKPPAGSPAATAATSWEPSGQAAKNGDRQAAMGYRAGIKAMRRRYAIAVTGNWGINHQSQPSNQRLSSFLEAGMKVFEGFTVDTFSQLLSGQEQELFDREALAVEEQYVSPKRARRACNECRFKRGDFRRGPRRDGESREGDWRHRELNAGTELVPIIRSRPVMCVNAVERYFPKFWVALENGNRPVSDPPLLRIYRENVTVQPWATFMTRCPGCAQWKELRSMRCGGTFPHWSPDPVRRLSNWDKERMSPELINGLLCNPCFAEKHGRDALGKVLCEWWMSLVKWHMMTLNSRLDWWSYVRNRKSYYKLAGCWEEVKKEVLEGLPQAAITDEWALANLALLRERHDRYVKIHERMIAEGAELPRADDDWTLSWLYKYEDTEAYWVWLWRCREELQRNPQALVPWALGEIPTS
ncbi:hypothetical protein BX600DRAFT_443928 [Xylariales sp. PMI_506]|nr:hypothetical protein BX600DRAFT_443928 [Xylariales sp. PMI_506]